MAKEEKPKEDMYHALAESLERLTAPGCIGGKNQGDWVLIGRVELAGGQVHEGVPVMEPKRRLFMRRFSSAEEAIAASVLHSSTRVCGGWALNLVSGDTVLVRPFSTTRGEDTRSV